MGVARINLKGGKALVVDPYPMTRGVIAQILRGFEMEAHEANTGAKARSLFAVSDYDLCIVEAALPDMECSDFLRWLRHRDGPSHCTPVIVLTGYTRHLTVATVRDAGANAVVKKPVASATLLDHIVGVARSRRAFVESDDYAGPDRRFKDMGPPGGFERRAPAQEDVAERIPGRFPPAGKGSYASPRLH